MNVYKFVCFYPFVFLGLNRLNISESAIFVSLRCSLLPEDLHSELIFTSLQLVLCRVATVKRLPVIILVQIFFLILWGYWANSESV